MHKRVYIVHGWGGYPEEAWLPWLKSELEAKGIEVSVPAMPDTDTPKIETWVPFLAEQVGPPDADTYFVGHSIGCQAILRYLQTLPEGAKIGGCIFVAPWMELDAETIEEEGEESIVTAKPWVETPIDWDIVRSHCDSFVTVFSDNDPFVPLRNRDLFKEKLNAKTIVERGKGHFSQGDAITQIPTLLAELEKMMR